MASYRRWLAAQCIPSGPFQAGGLVEVMTALYESPAEGEAEGSWAALPRLGHAWPVAKWAIFPLWTVNCHVVRISPHVSLR
jgi:hypothetical protein